MLFWFVLLVFLFVPFVYVSCSERTKDGCHLAAHSRFFERDGERRSPLRLAVRDQAKRITAALCMAAVKPVSVFDQVNRSVKLIE